MENIQKLLLKISEVTRDLETNYPEVYEFLDENPITIPNQEDPKIGAKELQNYLDSLNDLIQKYKEEH